MLTEEIRNLPPKERIILIEEIWETLCQDSQVIDSPEWHRDTLDERRKLIESGQAVFLSIDDLK